MKLSYRTFTLPLFAGLAMASAIACSEGTSTADDETGGTSNAGGSNDGAGGSTASTKTSGGAASEGGSTATASTGITKAWEFANDGENFAPSWAMAFGLDGKEDATASAALKANTTVEWMQQPGYGGNDGYLAVGVPFAPTQSSYQQIEIASNLATSLDLSGKILHCYVKLVSGATSADTSNPSGGRVVVKTGAAWTYAGGTYTDLPAGQWKDLSLDATTPDSNPEPTAYNAAEVVQIAISVNTGGTATVAEPAVLHVDHCWY